MTAATSTSPRRQARSERTRERILDAALVEFSTNGFEAASTRAIAARAGVHQPQIHYHFDTKDSLWRAAVDHLFDLLDRSISLRDLIGAGPSEDDGERDHRRRSRRPDARDMLEALVRRFVHFAAEHPELNRIMVQEDTKDSERLAWIADHHVQPRFDGITALLAVAAVPHLRDADPLVLYYSLIGAASLLYVNAPEGRRLTGREPTDPAVIERHADALVAMFVGPPATTTNKEP